MVPLPIARSHTGGQHQHPIGPARWGAAPGRPFGGTHLFEAIPHDQRDPVAPGARVSFFWNEREDWGRLAGSTRERVVNSSSNS